MFPDFINKQFYNLLRELSGITFVEYSLQVQPTPTFIFAVSLQLQRIWHQIHTTR